MKHPEIMLKLSPGGTRVDHFVTTTLPEQIRAGRVLDALALDLATFDQAVKRAYRSVERHGKRQRPPVLVAIAPAKRAPEPV
jgi:hypothetical protein